MWCAAGVGNHGGAKRSGGKEGRGDAFRAIFSGVCTRSNMEVVVFWFLVVFSFSYVNDGRTSHAQRWISLLTMFGVHNSHANLISATVEKQFPLRFVVL